MVARALCPCRTARDRSEGPADAGKEVGGVSLSRTARRTSARIQCMALSRVFFGYMALAGAATGAILVAAPHVQDFVVKPYFWVLIALGLFDGGIYLFGRTSPATM